MSNYLTNFLTTKQLIVQNYNLIRILARAVIQFLSKYSSEYGLNCFGINFLWVISKSCPRHLVDIFGFISSWWYILNKNYPKWWNFFWLELVLWGPSANSFCKLSSRLTWKFKITLRVFDYLLGNTFTLDLWNLKRNLLWVRIFAKQNEI